VLSIRVVTDRGDPNFGKYERESNAEVQKALARAITVATRRGADVISMSLGYGAASRPVRVALQNALDHGVVVVASSGNSGDTASALSTGQAPYSFPADYPGVLGVGAVTQAGTAANFSSNNLSVEVAAPGVKVPAQGRDGQYWLVSGTSPACALTAGVAALIKSRYPHLSPALVDQAITSTAQNPPPQGYDDRVGFGTVDAATALTAAATLSRDVSTGRGVKVATHFGGGAAAVPPVPVAPRGTGRLILYAVLVLACLAIAALAAVRLTRRSPAAVPADESWENNDPWPGNAPWPGNRAWEGNGAWPGSGAPPGHGARGDNGAWPANGAPPRHAAGGGNGTWGGDRARPGGAAWEGERPGPGNAAWEADGARRGSGAWDGDGARPGDAAWEGHGAWKDDRDWNGNGEWPGGGQRPARRSRWQAPSGDGTAQQTPPASLVPPVPDSPIPPGAPPAPSYLPDPSLRDLPPAQTPPAEPGLPWPPPGP
jgi:hypothetical protein